MASEEFAAPYEPLAVPKDKGGVLKQFCESPTNGRLEWVKAMVTKADLNKGDALISHEMKNLLLAGDKQQMDKPALIIHKTLGGTGDEPWNVFLEGRAFDRDTYDNDVESTVFHALNGEPDGSQKFASITIKFLFKNTVTQRPFKLSYLVELPNGDVIENDLSNA